MKEMEKGKFRRERKEIVIVLLEKLIEKSPLQYKICHLSSCVYPVNMAIQKSRSVVFSFSRHAIRCPAYEVPGWRFS